MRTFWLDIELLSELTTSSGDGFEGLVDIDVFHLNGLPFIPAKRLKGALLEAGKELADWGLVNREHLQALFGETGQRESGQLYFHDGVLYRIPKSGAEVFIEDVPGFLRQLRAHHLDEREVLEFFTDLHTRTAIDEQDGSAKEGHLRTIRAVHRGTVFRCRIEWNDDREGGGERLRELEETLRMCVKGVRHLGLASTRGSGEVRCELKEREEEPAAAAAGGENNADELFRDLGGGRVEVLYQLVLEQPVIVAGRKGLADRSENWIAGSALLGAFAGLYLQEYGSPGVPAHEDERFSRIFLRDGVQFGYALPLAEGKVFAAASAAWQQEKHTDRVYDLLRTGTGTEESRRVLRSMEAMVHADDSSGKLYRYHVRKQVRMHHARAKNRAIGRALGEPPEGEEELWEALEPNPAKRGQLYQYESIEAGQRFCGVLRGSREDVRLLLELAEKNGRRLRLGRSRTAEYGHVRFIPQPPGAAPLVSGMRSAEEPAARVAVLLVTPMLLMDRFGRPDPDPAHLARQMEERLGCCVQIEESWLRYTMLSGYNAQWRLPKPQRLVLDAGTALILRLDGPFTPGKLESVFWGWETGEGLGQIRVLPLERKERTGVSFTLVEAVDEGEAGACAGEIHPLLPLLLDYKRDKQAEAEQRAAGAAKADEFQQNELRSVGLVKIQQLKMRLNDAAGRNESDGGGYEALCEMVEKIKDDETKRSCEKLIDPCKGKSYTFIRSYLRALELRARGRE